MSLRRVGISIVLLLIAAIGIGSAAWLFNNDWSSDEEAQLVTMEEGNHYVVPTRNTNLKTEYAPNEYDSIVERTNWLSTKDLLDDNEVEQETNNGANE